MAEADIPAEESSIKALPTHDLSYEEQLALVESMMTCYDTPITQAAGYTRDLLKTIIALKQREIPVGKVNSAEYRKTRYLLLEAKQKRRYGNRRQPIETAPKDGTRILLWVEHENLRHATGDERKRWEGWCIGRWSFHNGGGWTHDGMFGKITGWASLPNVESDL